MAVGGCSGVFWRGGIGTTCSAAGFVADLDDYIVVPVDLPDDPAGVSLLMSEQLGIAQRGVVVPGDGLNLIDVVGRIEGVQFPDSRSIGVAEEHNFDDDAAVRRHGQEPVQTA